MKRSLPVILICLSTAWMFSQNLEKIGKKDMIRVNGGLNFNSIFYNANGLDARRNPFTWYANGNLTVNILDVSLPFNYSYSNNQGKFTQPFNMTNCTPTYKWVKAYAGFNSMTFSNYTLAGHVFLGGGLELTPKKWKIAAMYGRFKKAVPYDMVNETDNEMSYKRMGYGAKVGYDGDIFGVHLIYFTAKDDINSIPFIPPVTQITPQANTAISALGRIKLAKSWAIEGEYALSGLNKNLLASDELTEGNTNKFRSIFNEKGGMQLYSAYKGSLSYTHKIVNVGVNYEHVDPDYKTLGAYFFNNDLENYTLSTGWRLLKNRINIATNTGLQKNNLDKSKLSTTKRWVGSVNLTYAPSSKWNFSGSYSNFSTYTNVRPVSDPYYIKTPADTLNFYQLTQNANATANYNFGKHKAKQGIMLTANYQTTGQKTGNVADIPSNMMNGNIGYSFAWTPTKTTAALSFNYNQSDIQKIKNVYFGPNLSLSQNLAKNKVRLTLGSGYNQVINDGVANSKVVNSRFSLAFNPKMKNEKLGKPSISLNCVYLNKLATAQQVKTFNEFTGTLNLGYTF